eukprot:6316261-Amphidinium_carterae.1
MRHKGTKHCKTRHLRNWRSRNTVRIGIWETGGHQTLQNKAFEKLEVHMFEQFRQNFQQNAPQRAKH